VFNLSLKQLKNTSADKDCICFIYTTVAIKRTRIPDFNSWLCGCDREVVRYSSFMCVCSVKQHSQNFFTAFFAVSMLINNFHMMTPILCYMNQLLHPLQNLSQLLLIFEMCIVVLLQSYWIHNSFWYWSSSWCRRHTVSIPSGTIDSVRLFQVLR